MTTKTTAPARERLLAAANELFYEEGVLTVGIDRIIERAGVAKASLYSTFGSKDELIRAYLTERHDSRRVAMEAGLAGLEAPRERILGVFDVLTASVSATSYRGCAFINASAEARPGGAVFEATDDYRAWIRSLFFDQAVLAGVADPDLLTLQLMLIYDGTGVSARMCATGAAGSPTTTIDTVTAAARSAATVLLDAALPA